MACHVKWWITGSSQLAVSPCCSPADPQGTSPATELKAEWQVTDRVFLAVVRAMLDQLLRHKQSKKSSGPFMVDMGEGQEPRHVTPEEGLELVKELVGELRQSGGPWGAFVKQAAHAFTTLCAISTRLLKPTLKEMMEAGTLFTFLQEAYSLENELFSTRLGILPAQDLRTSYVRDFARPILQAATADPGFFTLLQPQLHAYLTCKRLMSRECSLFRLNMCLLTEAAAGAAEDLEKVLKAWQAAVIAELLAFYKSHFRSSPKAVTHPRLVMDRGAELVSGAAMAAALVDGLSDVAERLKTLALSCRFPAAVREAGEAAFAKAYRQLPKTVQLEVVEQLSVHVNVLLDTGSEAVRGAMPEQARQAAIAKVTGLLHHLRANDDLQPLYEVSLARRLVRGRYHSLREECEVLAQLDFAATFTRARHMLQEVMASEASHDLFTSSLLAGYDSWVLEKGGGSSGQEESGMPCNEEDFLPGLGEASSSCCELSAEFRVTTLSAGVWPSGVLSNLELRRPPAIEALQSRYLDFYQRQHSSRTLRCFPRMGSVVLGCRSEQGEAYELMTTPLQACVLLLFNRTDSLAVPAVCEALGVDTEAATEALEALAAPAHPILQDGTEKLTFTYNPAFSPPRLGVRLTIHATRRGRPHGSKNLKGKVVVCMPLSVSACSLTD